MKATITKRRLVILLAVTAACALAGAALATFEVIITRD